MIDTQSFNFANYGYVTTTNKSSNNKSYTIIQRVIVYDRDTECMLCIFKYDGYLLNGDNTLCNVSQSHKR